LEFIESGEAQPVLSAVLAPANSVKVPSLSAWRYTTLVAVLLVVLAWVHGVRRSGVCPLR
jgi:hypothetical protein